MSRRFLPLFVFGLAGLVGFALGADEPKADDDAPVRLKKKHKQPVPEQPKDDKAKDDLPKDDKAKDDKARDDKAKDDKAKDDNPKDVENGPGAKEDEKEVLERISRNMKAVEDRFINKELNEGTRQLKDDIIKDIDSLIKMAENPPPDDSGGSGGSPPPSGNDKNGGQSKQGRGSRQPMEQGGMNQGGMNQGGMNQGGMNPNGMNPMKGSNQGNGTTGRGVTTDNNPPKPPTEDEKGKWGQLPAALRAQMNAYATREEYMAKHQELIKEYYRNLAKQAHNK